MTRCLVCGLEIKAIGDHLACFKAVNEINPVSTPGGVTGGANVALTANELALKAAMDKIFKGQLRQLQAGDFISTMQFDWVASETWADEIYKLTHDLIGYETNLSGVAAGRKLGVNLTDFIDRPNVQHAIKDHTFKFANAVNKTTAANLKRTLSEGAALGEDMPGLTERVRTVFGFDKADSWRAERIARTESKRAAMTGEIQGWSQTGIVTGYTWDANGDSCPFCMEMNGRRVDMGQEYFPEGDELTVEFKGKPITMSFNYIGITGPPLHPDCRCGLKPELIDIGGG